MMRQSNSTPAHPAADESQRASLSPRFTLTYCLIALLLFSFLSYSAASTKCSTSDEPAHALSAYAALLYSDFRINPEHPPLWKYFAALPLLIHSPIHVDLNTPAYRNIPANIANQWPWCVNTLYHTPGNNPDRLLARMRFMMLLCAVALAP